MPVSAEHFYAAIETRLGRPLTAGERKLDVVAALVALELGKQRLRDAIEQEKRRSIRAALRGGQVGLRVTDEMRAAVVALFDAGRKHALAELRAHGVEPARALARDEPGVDFTIAALTTHLRAIQLRVGRESAALADAGTLEGLSVSAMVREVDRVVPGALDAASRLVSGAYGSGLAEVFGTNADPVSSWTYSAMMDGATCEECQAHDGEEFDSWGAISEVLPDGGPNPACYGDGRCRCRPVIGSVAAPAG